MIDVTHDVNIAKAFASLEASQGPRTPALYKVALLGIGCFERGAQSLCDPELGPRFQLCLSEKGRPVVLPLTDLPFRRPKVQRAASVLGLTADMGDPDGTVVALTEHPFYVTEHGSSWDAFGGPGFALGERRFESVFLDNVDSKELTRLLYPSESRTVASMFNLICDKVEQHLASFGLASEDEAAVAARLRGLREEMALATD
jgi:hypothetical protein